MWQNWDPSVDDTLKNDTAMCPIYSVQSNTSTWFVWNCTISRRWICEKPMNGEGELKF